MSTTYTDTLTHVHNLPNESLYSEESTRSVAATAEPEVGLEEE